jgi:carboxypeptidase C (cathepsin A)
MHSFTTAIALVGFSLTLGFAQAQEAQNRPASPPPQQAQTRGEGLPPLPANVTTRHKLELPGRSLDFAATAGTIRLFDANSGAPHADMAFIAFTRDGAPRERPVTFIFNGGPGYASGWLHLGALGPWRIEMGGDAARPTANIDLLPNAQTWLDFTDLVFLDPAGTGYSRVLGNEEVRKSLWSINGDVNALAVTIRRWVQANGREQSPKFILGESYGGFRAPKIAHVLQNDQGIGVNGLVLVAPVLDFARFDASGSVLSHVARLPAYAAVARERKGAITRENLRDVENYARGEFLSDLMRGVNDKDALARLTKRVTELTGLDENLVRRLGARIPIEVFAREINRDQQRVSSLYDGNITGLDPAPFSAGNHAQDQLRLGLHAPITQAMVELYRSKLNWVVENGRYQFMNEQAGRQWDRGRGAEAVSDLRQAMALDPKLRVLIAHGLTDLVTPYFETRMVLDQVPDFGAPDRIRFETYAGGHMLYFREASRIKFREDGRKLIEAR